MNVVKSKDLFNILEHSYDLNISFENINTDTRKIKKGDCFVAIIGDNFDGHNFVKKAEQLGCAIAIVSSLQDGVNIPQILVTDTRVALAKIAKFIRNKFEGKVVGLTGSVGKTTNKQMLKSVLSVVGKTHATKGNLNNDLGVPFTFFDLAENMDSKFAVIEMGASATDEIAYLSDIARPDVAMITNAGEAHLEGFGGLDGVAKGKAEIFLGLDEQGTGVVNLDDYYSDFWLDKIADKNKITFSYEDCNADVFATDIADDFSSFKINYKGIQQYVELPLLGKHNILNALGVSACALSLGVSLIDVATGLASTRTEKGRLQIKKIRKLNLVDDSYNANPLSVKSSAAVLFKMSGYKIFILGEMKELGANEKNIHFSLGENIKGFADEFLCLGDLTKEFVNGVGVKAKYFSDVNSLNEYAFESIFKRVNEEKPISVMVKGSRSMHMELVVEYLETKIKKEIEKI